MPLHRSIKYLWASPASLIGLVLAGVASLLGVRLAVVSGVVEVTLNPRRGRLQALSRHIPFAAITFGHVVIAVSDEDQTSLRCHERAHVAQYEVWGPLFLLAYPAESALQLLLGRRAYLDNRFELQARRKATLAARSAALTDA